MNPLTPEAIARLGLMCLPDGSPKRVRQSYQIDIGGLSAAAALERLAPSSAPTERAAALARADEIVTTSTSHGIAIYSLDHPQYPAPLRAISAPPPFLYAKGTMPERWDHAVAVVGSRSIEPDASDATIRVVEALTAEPKTIVVSGLAIGVDSVAHVRALNRHLCTVAVLGNGLDTVYPSGQRALAGRIVASGGCLLSEVVVGTYATRASLIARDRIQSGLARAVFVMQTSIDGGTMHTARAALEQDRTLLAFLPRDQAYGFDGNRFLTEKIHSPDDDARSQLRPFAKFPRPLAHTLAQHLIEPAVLAGLKHQFIPRARRQEVEQASLTLGV